MYVDPSGYRRIKGIYAYDEEPINEGDNTEKVVPNPTKNNKFENNNNSTQSHPILATIAGTVNGIIVEIKNRRAIYKALSEYKGKAFNYTGRILPRAGRPSYLSAGLKGGFYFLVLEFYRYEALQYYHVYKGKGLSGVRDQATRDSTTTIVSLFLLMNY